MDSVLFPGCWAGIPILPPETCADIFDDVKTKVANLARDAGFIVVPTKPFNDELMVLWKNDELGHAGKSNQQDWGYAAAAERLVLGLIVGQKPQRSNPS
jgi:hypothetical protein